MLAEDSKSPGSKLEMSRAIRNVAGGGGEGAGDRVTSFFSSRPALLRCSESTKTQESLNSLLVKRVSNLQEDRPKKNADVIAIPDEAHNAEVDFKKRQIP